MADQNLCGLPNPRPPRDYPNSTTPLLIYSLTLTLTFLAVLTAKTLTVPVNAQVLHDPILSPSVAPSASLSPSPSPSPEPTEAPLLAASGDLIQEREAIRQYINVIFGSNAKTAYAIALAESGRSYKGTRVFKTDAVQLSDYELSVGLFQVNLRSKEAKVHWARVPGQTEDEKIKWLKNPYNNTLFAYWVYSTSGFFPWTTYTNNTYLAYVR
jgi:hypothetical protein